MRVCDKNNINSKQYVGITTYGASYRFNQHVAASRRGDTRSAIHKAIAKYGSENFFYEILQDNVNVEELGELEKEYISKLNSLVPNGYNIRTGGNDSGAKPVYQIQPYTGEIINEFPSMTCAAIISNLSLGNISNVCRSNSPRKSCGGYLWCFVEDYNRDQYANIRPHLLGRAVYQIIE